MFPIKILDDKGKVIGELMTATNSDVAKLINKGFTVVNIETNQVMTLESVTDTFGVSDGTIMLG